MRKVMLTALSFLVILSLFVPACRYDPTSDQQYRMQLVDEIKAFEKTLGFKETSNFRRYSSRTQAYDYYFYAPRFELPYSLGDPLLQFGTGTADNATIDRTRYDVFFYSIQAIASVGTPVTRSLMEAPLYRFIHVIFHEDWHEQINPPLSLGEPAAEVIGYAAALQFTRQKFGENSEVYRTLKDMFGKKTAESAVYTEYYEKLSSLYASFRAGALSETETLERKQQLLGEMSGALRLVWGASPELNNAFIAFQMTYVRHFPLLHRVLAATGNDLPRTVEIFRAMPGLDRNPENIEQIKQIENEVADYLKGVLDRLPPPATPAPGLSWFPAWLLPDRAERIAVSLPAVSP